VSDEQVGDVPEYHFKVYEGVPPVQEAESVTDWPESIVAVGVMEPAARGGLMVNVAWFVEEPYVESPPYDAVTAYGPTTEGVNVTEH